MSTLLNVCTQGLRASHVRNVPTWRLQLNGEIYGDRGVLGGHNMPVCSDVVEIGLLVQTEKFDGLRSRVKDIAWTSQLFC